MRTEKSINASQQFKVCLAKGGEGGEEKEGGRRGNNHHTHTHTKERRKKKKKKQQINKLATEKKKKKTITQTPPTTKNQYLAVIRKLFLTNFYQVSKVATNASSEGIVGALSQEKMLLHSLMRN